MDTPSARMGVALRTVLLSCATFAATAALADPQDEMTLGYRACLASGGNPNTAYAYLNAEGWEGDVDDEQGIGYVYPPQAAATVVTIGMDGSWCNVESHVESSETASKLLLAVLEGPYNIEYDKDDMGCTKFNLGQGLSATVLSGGQDQVCGAAENSAVRFEFNYE